MALTVHVGPGLNKQLQFLEACPGVTLLAEPLEWLLFADEDGRLCLGHVSESQRSPLLIDFNSSSSVHKAKSLQKGAQPLLKALGKIEQGAARTVFDLTAGLGGDSFLMLSAGYSVTMVEENPLVYLLLKEALEKWDNPKESSFSVVNSEASLFLEQAAEKPDVIYLDPMFPEKKKGRLSQGPMQWLQMLLTEVVASPEVLLNSALDFATDRVVVKRGLKDPKLNGPLIHSFKGSSVRYDMYKVRANS